MNPQTKTDHEHSPELQQARQQNAAASHQRLYELAEKITGMSTRERVAAAAKKRATPPCPSK